ncbi:MAG: aldehyde dehydrogenase [Chitinophagales bacterium]|nr:aldehyde dehydrogenase [Chitinophagales bacterium]MCZ2392635.1 aldehyde dehydrogenase [Chitinophagales bacterium]
MATTITSNIEIVFDAKTIVQQQRDYFSSGKTKPISFRIAQLKKLRQIIVDNESAILKALYDDLKKSELEAYATEVGIVISEIDEILKNITSWSKPQRVKTPLFHQLATSWIYPEPYGVTYIIAPWNYPFQLLIAPLLGAMAAGNTAILKPSELSENTALLIQKLISENFEEGYIRVVVGGVEESKAMLEQRFDYIFFTGGTEIGRYVYQSAAKYLTPVTLELGGKSPCIVDEDIQLTHTSRRILWGKFTNAGQTCVAPDYLLVNKKVKTKLIEKMKEHLNEFYAGNPATSPDYGRIISERHFDRISKMINPSQVIYGGQTNRAEKYIAPTFVEGVSIDDRVMQEEIFGPVLPVIEYNTLDEAIAYIKQFEKPLALYIYSENSNVQNRVLDEISFGGGCINESIMHVGQGHLPFGGVGESGIGAYHGKSSFDTFSHQKSVLKKSTITDMPIKYPPYKNNKNLIKKLMAWFN